MNQDFHNKTQNSSYTGKQGLLWLPLQKGTICHDALKFTCISYIHVSIHWANNQENCLMVNVSIMSIEHYRMSDLQLILMTVSVDNLVH